MHANAIMWNQNQKNGRCQRIFTEIRKLIRLPLRMNEFFDYLLHTSEHCDFVMGDNTSQSNKSLWITGREYDPFLDIDTIIDEIQSKLWFTYRTGFDPIGNALGPTTDKGWGCMLRCGQMLLANALMATCLGKHWIWKPDTCNPTYIDIVQKFEDSFRAPFSIHQVALTGRAEGKDVGQWFGPNTISQVLKKLVELEEQQLLRIHIAMDNLLIKNEIHDLKQEQWKPLLLIIPVRLGLDEFNDIYSQCIKSFFEIEYCLGLIGGKPNSALYFIGYCQDNIYYLDPHHTQKTGSIGFKETNSQIEFDQTYHCKNVSKMPITKIDPSLALCFYCKTNDDFQALCNSIKTTLVPYNTNQSLIEIYDDRPNNLTYIANDSSSSSLIFEMDDIRSCNSDNDFEII